MSATAGPASGREDYDALAHFRQLAPGEPWFLIRGQDALGAAAVRAWAALAYDAGAETALVELALEQADRLEAWPAKKLPDAGMDAGERKQLAWKLARRAWRARADCADPAIMLAEERALGALRGQLAPLLRELAAGAERHEEGWSYTPSEEGRDALAALLNLSTVLRRPDRSSVVARLYAAAEAALAESDALRVGGAVSDALRFLGHAAGLRAAIALLEAADE